MVLATRAVGGSMAGTGSEPCGRVHLVALGGVGKATNAKFAEKITAHVHKELGIAPGRYVV